VPCGSYRENTALYRASIYTVHGTYIHHRNWRVNRSYDDQSTDSMMMYALQFPLKFYLTYIHVPDKQQDSA